MVLSRIGPKGGNKLLPATKSAQWSIGSHPSGLIVVIGETAGQTKGPIFSRTSQLPAARILLPERNTDDG